MTSILDHISKASAKFEPATVQQFTVLQIARKLSDLDSLRASVMFMERNSLSTVLGAYRKAMSGPNPAASFQNQLRQLTRP
jgi:hypothetical protein